MEPWCAMSPNKSAKQNKWPKQVNHKCQTIKMNLSLFLQKIIPSSIEIMGITRLVLGRKCQKLVMHHDAINFLWIYCKQYHACVRHRMQCNQCWSRTRSVVTANLIPKKMPVFLYYMCVPLLHELASSGPTLTNVNLSWDEVYGAWDAQSVQSPRTLVSIVLHLFLIITIDLLTSS